MSSLYLGLDLSTQQLKACAITEKLDVFTEVAVSFDTDFPSYGTKLGVHHKSDDVFSTPVLMFLEAIEFLFVKLKEQSFPFHLVKAISGAAQQHGSVYWKIGSNDQLKNLDPEKTLVCQLKESFTKTDCPMWMDMSTEKECLERESILGGPERVAEITGSRAYHRFTGNQIRKIFREEREAYDNCERISLFSSFLSSLFTGQHTGIEMSDASGMNILDINTCDWHQPSLDCTALGLREKLGQPLPGGHMCGNISPFFSKRFGFNSTTEIVAFTGDNPGSFIGMALQEGDLVLSLGTSDTVFSSIKPTTTSKDELDNDEKADKGSGKGCEGHLLVSPLDTTMRMGMLCFSNGSSTRNHFVEKYCNGSFEEFSHGLNKTTAGNDGNLAFFYIFKEIIPRNVQGCFRFGSNNEEKEEFSNRDIELRALIEGQVLSRYHHSINLGWEPHKGKLLVTGGASKNKEILQIIADVFAMPVYLLDISNSAGLGGAYLAMWAGRGSFDWVTSLSQHPTRATEPNKEAVKIYEKALRRFITLEKKILKECTIFQKN